MALEDTDNMDTGPDTGGNGNGDEQSNRTFRILMLVMGGIGLLAVILIAVGLISNQGQRRQFEATQQAVQSTNEAVAQLSAITPEPPTATTGPTDTPVPPTATLPPTAAPTKAAPTTAPTVAPTSAASSGTSATAEPTKSGSATGSTASGTPKAEATSSGQKPAATSAASSGSSSTSGTPGPKVTVSSSVTTTKPTSGTVGSGETQVPKTGAGDSLGMIALAAGLVAVFVIARRLRTSQA